MRQTHMGGDKLFVDYAGDTVPVIIDVTGETREAQIFVAVLGASNFTMRRRPGLRGYPIGSAPTPAPLRRSAACRVCWCPTTPRSPSSKPACTSRRSTEPMRRWRITGPPCCRPGPIGCATRPRSRSRCSSSSAGFWRGCAIGGSTAWPSSMLRSPSSSSGSMTNRLGRTRRQLLEEIDRPALKPLPVEPYVFAQWRVCRVGIDYQVSRSVRLTSRT